MHRAGLIGASGLWPHLDSLRLLPEGGSWLLIQFGAASADEPEKRRRAGGEPVIDT